MKIGQKPIYALFARKPSIVPKVEFILKIILFITIFFTKVQEAVLNPGPAINLRSVIKLTHLKASPPIVLFSQLMEGKIFHQKSLMTHYTFIFHSEAT